MSGPGTSLRGATLERYRPSGNVGAVLAEILAGHADAAPHPAAQPARADSTEADRRQRLAACQLRERAALEGQDADVVERERKARLVRWQGLDSRG